MTATIATTILGTAQSKAIITHQNSGGGSDFPGRS
eukprot:CAMPEP_0203917720 /NCGR_PEP_ID=MMETSP0359-20131031/58309_1 /ASSEMBLY_ACC=CAM_ASM_000338 /TAXON_ID=268821 /ORGANISM="Scrippsiella Hangoei, Strain SHTV-5" /LENGTH=34 /DNA_ID= /DNA_START= /DNA_END= /DNA_ORIENTATION=